MKSYIALIDVDLTLLARNKTVPIFQYVFPLLFFLFVAGIFKLGDKGSSPAQVLAMVFTLGMLANGLYGAGMRLVQDREGGTLRRYKVAPITPLPLLVASIVTGWTVYVPLVIGLIVLGRVGYGMPWPARPVTFAALVLLGLAAFRAMGLIIAAVANTTQESNSLIQLAYAPSLLLSGATVPLSVLPGWAVAVAKYLPASYLVAGLRAELDTPDPLPVFAATCLALIATTTVCLFLAAKLFRWEPEQRLSGTAKLWLLAALAPFIILGLLTLV
jgi:ABC-2 type transport system permease protein